MSEEREQLFDDVRDGLGRGDSWMDGKAYDVARHALGIIESDLATSEAARESAEEGRDILARDLLKAAKELEKAERLVLEIGKFASSYSFNYGRPTLLRALDYIAEKCGELPQSTDGTAA